MTTQNDPSVPAGGFLGSIAPDTALFASAAASYGVPLLGYEGGQQFVGLTESSNATNLFIAANRDPRMAGAYAILLNTWKANGGTLLNLYNDISPYSQYGEWGALESITQVTMPLVSAPPKWQAIVNFSSANPCWWSACSGTSSANGTADIPQTPSSVTAN
jgi:hypothetical protein